MKRLLLIAFGFSLLFLGFSGAYTADTYSNVILTLTEEPAPTDSCTYSGTGDWNITMGDYCIITTDTDVTTNKIIFHGSGNCTIDSTIDAGNMVYPEAGGMVFMDDDGRINLG